MTAASQGHVVAVSGAGGGIGRAVSVALARHGSTVVALDTDASRLDALRAELGDSVVTVTGDATTAQANDEVSARCREQGRLDALVCCVGIFDQYRAIATLSATELDDAFDEIFSTNVKSALHAIRAVLPQLVDSSGTVLLTLSGAAFHPEGGGFLYGSTKWALRGAVTHLARELAPHVRVNAVAPGGVSGTSIGGLRSVGQASGRIEDPARDERLRRRSPLGALIKAEDTVASYLFLLGPGARAMTGRTLHPDGGLTVPQP